MKNPGYADLTAMAWWARDVMTHRPTPDFIIGPGQPGTSEPDYIRRWWMVPRNESLNLYLHMTQRSDDDRALHDHPWTNTSFILEGGYREVRFTDPERGEAGGFDYFDWKAGDVITREASCAHRLIIPDGGHCISLFATGPKVREWGFHCPKGWRHWKDFTAFNSAGDSASVGPGCE